ncbi:MAG: glycoside hydrolase family 31 protein [Alkalispirochaeta sp.]
MHARQNRWLSLGALRGSDADSFSLTYHFSHGECTFSVSGDEWTKIELALRDAGYPGTVQGRTGSAGAKGATPAAGGTAASGGAGPVRTEGAEASGDAAGRRHPRRSWALDPLSAARRRWRACDVDAPIPFTDTRTRRYVEANQGVEGNVNPHEDTRGIVPVTVAGERFDLPMSGRVGEAGGGDGTPAVILDEIEISRSRDGFLLSVPIPEGVRAYGLGEKTGGLDKAGKSWVMWNTDEPWHTGNRDPLYQSIPVVYLTAAAGEGGTNTGAATIFVDSTATIWFDIGEGDPGRLQIEVYDPDATVYLRHDPSLPEAVTAYTGLTGRTPLPPEWALGFQQCRYSYFPESRVIEVAEKMRASGVPCDVIYLDIHYMDGYRVFTWDPARFPDPKAMIDRLHEKGFRLVTIIDPGVKKDTDYPVFADGLSRGMYLEDPGRGPYVGTVWPGEAVFPDFTRTTVQEWWADHHAPLFEAGVDGIWNDMNEPADFSGTDEYRPDFTVPGRLVAGNDGEAASMDRLHNAYANGMNAGTRRALERYRGDERGFVLTRGGYAGVQRNAAVWTGDNHSWWEHIALMQPMLMNLGLSGVAFAGGDVGGFQQNGRGELYARWIAAASLMPFFRAHSALDTVDHEPWSFGDDVLKVARRFVGLRYRLLPYLYTLFEEASRTGAPVIRPLVWEFPGDPRVARRADSYMVGNALLVAPVMHEGVQERSVYLPAGIWYDLWSGERYDTRGGAPVRGETGGGSGRGTNTGAGSGGRVVACEAPLDRIPIFVRGGTVVPFESLRQHTGEAGDGVLRALVAPDERGRAAGHVYGDAGEGYGYRNGEFWRATLAWHDGALSVEADGSMAWTRWSTTETFVIGEGRGF